MTYTQHCYAVLPPLRTRELCRSWVRTVASRCVLRQANRTSAISEAIGDVLDLWDEMGEEPQTDFERALTNNGAGLGVTLDVIQQISELASALTAKKVRPTNQAGPALAGHRC